MNKDVGKIFPEAVLVNSQKRATIERKCDRLELRDIMWPDIISSGHAQTHASHFFENNISDKFYPFRQSSCSHNIIQLILQELFISL